MSSNRRGHKRILSLPAVEHAIDPSRADDDNRSPDFASDHAVRGEYAIGGLGTEVGPHQESAFMDSSRFRSAAGGLRGKWSGLITLLLALAIASGAIAQAPAAPGGAAPPYSAEELDQLVGPIALYPDDLVAIILPASTNPLQLVQADRYLDKRKADPKAPIDDKWDDPVKSLLNYPDVVKKMSADLDWTSALGEAVVADQAAVIEAVQAFRRKAKAAGNLKSDDKQVVKTEQEIVIIEPADPQVIYVPQYNPTTVVVQSAVPVYGYYPAPYPSYYYPYPPGAAMAAGVIWGAAIGAAWSGNHYGCCGDTNINVNRNTNINTGNVNRGSGARQQPAGGSTAWKSNKQPGQVSGSVGKTASTARAGDTRAGAGGGAGRASAQPAGGGAGRASTQPSSGAMAGGGASRGAGGGGDAFGSYGSGRQAQMDSSRGASSRSSMSGASSRSAPSGGARGGGGSRGGGGGRGGGRR
jgi:hypothetical protein